MPLLSDWQPGTPSMFLLRKKRIYYHYKQFRKCNCCRWRNLCCSAEAHRSLGYRDYAMRIRLFIVILALLLSVILVPADKPNSDKRLGSNMPARRILLLGVLVFRTAE